MGRAGRRFLRTAAYPAAFALSGLVVWHGSSVAFDVDFGAGGYGLGPDAPDAPPVLLGAAGASTVAFDEPALAPCRSRERCFSLVSNSTQSGPVRFYVVDAK